MTATASDAGAPRTFSRRSGKPRRVQTSRASQRPIAAPVEASEVGIALALVPRMSTTTSVTPRWEWRTFGDRFDEVDAVIALTPHSTATTRDLYLLGPRSDVNVKIRGGAGIDVKHLERVDGELELWVPVLKATFPLAPDTAARIWEHLDGDGSAIPSALCSLDALLDRVRRHPALRVVTVDKVRRGAVIDGCRVEIADLSIDGSPWRTVGVEQEDAVQVRRTVRVLGLADHRPSNYVRALKERLRISDCASGGR
jgi:exopolyphosphatase/guanosine-5'-triphosphate,3'-diphosphate pyrophosphatase